MSETPAARRVRRVVVEPIVAIAGLALMVMMGATVVDVVGRHLFNAPLSGVVEVVEFTMVWCTFAGIAAAAFLGAHIAVDLIDTVAGPALSAAVHVVAGLCATGVMGVLAWLSWRELLDAIDWGDTTVDLGIPHTFYWTAIFAGFALGAVLWGARVLLVRERAT
ncbi:MAG: TRAP transporter small permease [Devosia sp.]